MTLVPPTAHPGTPAAKQMGCTCDSPANFNGVGHHEEAKHTQGQRTFMQRYWIVDRACQVHGDLPPPPDRRKKQ